MRKILSKTRYLYGIQCPKLLWVATNQKERLPETDAFTQHVFDQGHLAGQLAQQLFPGGISATATGFMEAINKTRGLLKERKPLFEASVLSGQLFSRADILRPVNEDEWDIIEVKSSTQVKEINFDDVSFQKYCWEQDGIKINKCFLACINNQYIKQGQIEPEEFFNLHDITAEVKKAGEGIQSRIEEMLETIRLSSCPQASIGPHCSDPYPCVMTECWEHLPENNVFTLYYGGQKALELYQNGITDILNIPENHTLSERQRIQIISAESGQPHIDRAALHEFLDKLKYPLYFLDFETFSTAVPLFDGTRPYQTIPFQFSLHIQDSPGGKITHHSFLASGKKDPRGEFLAALCRFSGSNGSIVAYSKAFEEKVLASLAEEFPDYRECIENMLSRTRDLLEPFRNFYLYHPAQHGSASLKKVLPALTGLSYDEMPIARGDLASLAFLSIASGEMPESEVKLKREELLSYCKLDTGGMVKIVDRLRELAEI